MSTPSISVLIPVWKPHPIYFPKAIASVLNQTMSDFELVIVEDPSESNAAELLASFNDSRIRHLRQPCRTSLVEQFNRGVAEVRSPFTARMDADDECEPERLERQLTFLKEHPDITVCGSQLHIIDSNSQTLGYRVYPGSHEEIIAALPLFNPLGNPSVTMYTEALRGQGGYRAKAEGSADYDLWCRLARAGYRLANINEALLRYRIHGGSIKSTYVQNTIRQTLEIKERYWPVAPTWKALFRRQCEKLALHLPPQWVLKFFYMRNFHQALPD